MSTYRPDIYGTTPPNNLWAVFSAISKNWCLGTEERAYILGETPEPPNNPPPTGETAMRIELVKDCYFLVTGAQATKADTHGANWIRRPIPVFAGMSPLDVMQREPHYLRRKIAPMAGPMAIYWDKMAKPKPTMGLELVRGLFTFNKPDTGKPEAMNRLPHLLASAGRISASRLT